MTREFKLLFIVFAIVGSCSICIWLHSRRTESAQLSPFSTGDIGRFNFGIVAPGQTVEHVFRVTNGHGKTITPKLVRASCRCVSTVVERRPCAPQDYFDIRIVVRTDTSTRDLFQTVKIGFEDDIIPEMVFEVSGRVRPTLSLSAQRIDFDNLSLQSQDFLVENFDNRDWRSISVKSNVSWLDAKLSPTNSPGHLARQSWNCVVTPRPSSLDTGNHLGSIIVECDGGQQAVIPCTLLLRPQFVAFPASWFCQLGGVENQAVFNSRIISRTSHVLTRDDLQFDVPPVLAQVLKVELSTSETGGIELIGKPNVAQVHDEVRGNICIGLKGSKESITIPVLIIGDSEQRQPEDR